MSEAFRRRNRLQIISYDVFDGTNNESFLFDRFGFVVSIFCFFFLINVYGIWIRCWLGVCGDDRDDCCDASGVKGRSRVE